MSEPLAPLLEHWREFYLLVGTAAAALLALLFVAAPIGVGFLSPERMSRTRVFMSPVVLHFTAVLFTCSLGLVPSHTRASFAVLIAAGALAAAVYSIRMSVHVLEDSTIDLADKIFYGTVPVIAYAAALVAAGLVVLGLPHAADVLAGAVLLLLLVNIRNAWDLMLFLTEKHFGSPPM